MRLLETIFSVAVIVAFFLWKESLIFRVGGGAIFMLLGGVGGVCWRLKDRDEIFWKYIECLSFFLVMINLLYGPVTTWKDTLLKSAIFFSTFMLTPSLIVFFGTAYFPELRKLTPEARSRLIGYNSYNKSGSLQLFFRPVLYAGTPILSLIAIAYDKPKILPYYQGVMAYSVLVCALIYVLFVRKKRVITPGRDDRAVFPHSFFRILIGFLLFGLVYELTTRRHWFFYITSAFLFISVLKALPAYVRYCEPILSQMANPPDDLASKLMKTLLVEIAFAVPYAIVQVFILGVLVA